MKEIFERSSVRKYQDKKIENKQITRLLEAAMQAPSAGNEQPWHFIVVEDETTLSKMSQIQPYAKMLKNASHAIVVCGDLTLQKFEEDYWIQDCSAATQNILLESTHLGIGSVWLGIYPEANRVDKLKEILDIPADVIPLNIISLGYPSVETKSINRFDESKIHREKW